MKTVLVVDDLRAVRQQLHIALSQGGYEVVEACDGIDGLEKLAAHSVAAIILDLDMPRMNGLELLQRLGADPRFKGLPALVLSASEKHVVIERVKKAGAKGWISKPFHADALLAALTSLVEA